MKSKSLLKLPLLAIVSFSTVLLSCKTSKDYYEAPSVYGAKGKKIFTPPGMVYVPSGTILYKSEVSDEPRKISLSPFFMDATEVTNFQYREFVDWVADSIAVTDILKDEKFFINPSKGKKTASNKTVVKQINWSKLRGKGKTPLWKSKDPEIESKLISGNLLIEQGGKYILNKEMVKYTYLYRPVSGPNAGKFVNEIVNVFPETAVWETDFSNAQMELLADNYYYTKTFNHYPVVGVNWKQARAYCDWRGKALGHVVKKNNYLRAYQLKFSLPTEAQWQYAASGTTRPGEVKDSLKMKALVPTVPDKKKKNLMLVNFKQEEGEYALDGSTFTLPVKTYAPNQFGLYNMIGNVSEWVLDAFSPSAVEFVHDLNPVLLYDADDKAPLPMRRKVVRGGNWKDSGKLLDFETRNYELQDATHSYIGFRCVMPALEIPTEQVKTRKQIKSKSSKK